MKKVVLIGLGFIVLLVYFLSLYPDIYFGDSPEFVTSAYTLGIAHPTGYPLYTLITHLVTRLFIPENAAWSLNLFSALAGTGAIVIFYLLLSRHYLGFVKDNVLRVFYSIMACVLLGFTETFWGQATLTEVYTLQWFFILAILYSFEEWNVNKNRCLFLLGFLLVGMGFSHHLLTIVVIPSIVLILIMNRKELDLALFMTGISLLFLGWGSVLYLPIRSSCEPLINWGDPSNLWQFLDTITGRQYKWKMFSDSFNPNHSNFGYSLFELIMTGISQYGMRQRYFFILLFFPLTAISFFAVFRNRYLKLVPLSIFLMTSLVVILNYKISDINEYYIPVYMVSAILIVIGLSNVVEKINVSRHIHYLLICTFIVIPFLGNYSHLFHNKKSNRVRLAAKEYAQTVLNYVEPNGIIYTAGDYDILPMWYAQYVLHIRPDIAIVGTNFLSSPWYEKFLVRESDLIFKIYPTVFQYKEDYYKSFISDNLNPNIGKRPIYFSYYDPEIFNYYPTSEIQLKGFILPDDKQYEWLNYLYKLNVQQKN